MLTVSFRAAPEMRFCPRLTVCEGRADWCRFGADLAKYRHGEKPFRANGLREKIVNRCRSCRFLAVSAPLQKNFSFDDRRRCVEGVLAKKILRVKIGKYRHNRHRGTKRGLHACFTAKKMCADLGKIGTKSAPIGTRPHHRADARTELLQKDLVSLGPFVPLE